MLFADATLSMPPRRHTRPRRTHADFFASRFRRCFSMLSADIFAAFDAIIIFDFRFRCQMAARLPMPDTRRLLMPMPLPLPPCRQR
jgi:hypothetical protein